MAYWLVDPTNNIELQFDSISSFRMTPLSELRKYNTQAGNYAKVQYQAPAPPTINVSGIFHATTASFTDYMRKLLYFNNCGEELLLIDGHNEQAYLGYLEAPNFGKSDETNLTLPFSFSFVMKGVVVGFMTEAEDENGTGTPAAGVVTVDANASEGSCIVCDANTEGASIQIAQSTWKMPITDYRIYVRAKDTNQTANDLKLRIYNTSDSTDAGSGAKTCTAAYTWHSLDVTLASDDVGNNLEIQAYKDSATANSISIDMIICVAV